MKAGKVVERGLTEAIFERPVEEYTRSLIQAANRDGLGA
jgi:ABC-type oligopeptide transport system ATPase subunit